MTWARATAPGLAHDPSITPLATPPAAYRRLAGTRVQLPLFCVIGAVGTVLNILVYAGQVAVAQVAPLVAATVAFGVAVTHNYLANRWLTFRRSRAGFASQGARFAVVSTVALGVNLALLALFLGVMESIAAQALAISLTAPVNFLGNKLWSFAGAGA